MTELESDDEMYELINHAAGTVSSTLIVKDPKNCPGQYQCQVTFKMNYNGEETTLCTQSEPAILKKRRPVRKTNVICCIALIQSAFS